MADKSQIRAVFSEVAAKHLGAGKLGAVFPGFSSHTPVGVL